MGACASKKHVGATSVREASVEAVDACVSRTAVEERVERSRSHWSELTQCTDLLSVEKVAAIKLDNEEVFNTWKSHPEWGFFFWKLDEFQELKVGEKVAEGAQAELYNVDVRWWSAKDMDEDVANGRKWVVKVFKEGTSLRDLERQWPHGMFRLRSMRNKITYPEKSFRLTTALYCATLLEDGRFAFLMEKEDEDMWNLIERKMMKSGHSDGGPFLGVEAQEYMCDVVLGVDELHRFNVVHRDLKASNVLVYTSVWGNTFCIVSDYECSTGVIGTGYWRAPEILQACKEGNVMEKPELFSKAADVYSLGMTFYEILTGKHPFQDEEVSRDLIIQGRRPYVPKFVDEWIRQLLHWCWQPDCGMRPSSEDILGILEANSISKRIKDVLAERQEFLLEEETLALNEVV